MKTLCSTILVLLTFLSAPVCAQESGVTFTSEVLSDYLGQNGAIFYKGPVLITSLMKTQENGFYFEVWNLKSEHADELCFTPGWYNDNWDTGLSYSSIKNMGVHSDVFEFYVEGKLNFSLSPKNTISPFLRFDYYVPVHSNKPRPWYEAGFYYRLKTKRVEWETRLSYLYDKGAFDYMPGWLAKYQTKVNWKVGKHVVIEFPLFSGTHPYNMMDMKNETSFGGGIQINF